jgi:hypothetical protein
VEYTFDIYVGYQQFFLELFRPGDCGASFVENHAAAIKNQLVLAANQVAESHNSDIIGRPGAQHLFSELVFAVVVRRS